MNLLAVPLTTVALPNYIFGIRKGRGPIEPVPEGLGYQSPRCNMMSALSLMYVSEDLSPFCRLDASLQYAGDASLVHLVVDDSIGF